MEVKKPGPSQESSDLKVTGPSTDHHAEGKTGSENSENEELSLSDIIKKVKERLNERRKNHLERNLDLNLKDTSVHSSGEKVENKKEKEEAVKKQEVRIKEDKIKEKDDIEGQPMTQLQKANTEQDRNLSQGLPAQARSEHSEQSEQVIEQIQVAVLPTPNPNALKFVLNKTIKAEGKSTYRAPHDCLDLPLAQALFALEGVDNLHFFQNTITVTKFHFIDWDQLEPQIINCLQENAPSHDPHYHDPNPELIRRQNLSPELQEIEEILDRTIRPGLQSDGGDIVCVDFKNDVLLVKYQGACGTCPSSTSGTLEAIKSILGHEMQREIEVFIVPE